MLYQVTTVLYEASKLNKVATVMHGAFVNNTTWNVLTYQSEGSDTN